VVALEAERVVVAVAVERAVVVGVAARRIRYHRTLAI
jgi:hypothetical protein